MKKMAFLSIVLAIVLEAAVWAEDPVYFADANLKQCVINQLAKLEPPVITSDPTPTDMLRLNSLWASSSGVTDPTGLQYATNLTGLFLSVNQISDISALSSLTNLTRLTLSQNPLGDISALSGLTKLTLLSLDNTQISDISALSEMTNLTILQVQHNQISDISCLSRMTGLVELWANLNQISDISYLSEMTKLETLFLGWNQISDISALSRMTNLWRVTLAYNPISDISVLSGKTQVASLHLGGQPISDISALSGMNRLSDLTFPDTQVSDVSALLEMTSLRRLLMWNCPLDCPAYAIIPMIETNNPGIQIEYPPMPERCRNQPPVAEAGGPYLVATNQTIMLDGSGSRDDDGDSLTYLWTQDEILGSFDDAASDSPYFTGSQPGITDLRLVVSDGQADDSDSAMIVVYNPTGGFVTGGGWIDSPAGAYVPDPTLAGEAKFGFVSKYLKGATVPTGNTEFQFETGNLDFHSSSYEWLVVNQNGTNAQFKGGGTINGSAAYKFMLWARDNGNTGDTFRIKIWTEDDGGVEHVVYDNGFDQVIGGGSIVIHTK